MMNKKKLSGLLLVGTMVLSMGTTVFAEENTPNVDNKGYVSVTKNFEMAEGLSIPTATFQFTATPITKDAPTATINDISYSNADNKGNLEDGKYTISKDSAITFGTFPHAGLFEYTVKEIVGNADGVTYSTAEYTLRVYVANKDDGSLYVKNITADDGTGKKEKVLFTNTYKKDGSLIIEKNTTGDLADKTKDFEFTITFTKSATSNETTFNGKIGDINITFEDGQEKTFKLHDGQQLVFENLPVGTRYVVKEKGVAKDGYTPTITVIENGTVTVNGIKGNESDDLSSINNGNNNLVGENDNKVTFVNTYEETPITGVITNNIPFITLIGIAILAFGSLAIVKRQRVSKR
ncbi:DUF7601 domain-containing protein [Clostridium perfringens]|uniref:Pilin n=1 Tax=Clostridium perfringens TaxID=1502 RepID=A0AAW9IUA1_CLOPF|nr:FctA domain-containing protein [Clostridium perfringens]MBI6060853.1 hypothetical protein [Clostridium perfringens]MBI6080559.1 hypothetical protein [Clostridium perfringens]MBI6086280.1 hypothetical protein [Clostridium perfringens]MBI6100328.1 hypothetical protein [Clostridium perfringens]MDK0913336.1 FctA domain-containing protein [Clostridium perfringens]